MLQAISVHPDIQGGTPCFAGTRVPVKSLFDYLARDRSLDYFLEQFPSVKREQAMEVLGHAEQLLAIMVEGRGRFMMSVKEQVRKILDQLPEDCSVEDVQYQLYVIEKVRRGLEAIDEGKGIPHDQVKKRLGICPTE